MRLDAGGAGSARGAGGLLPGVPDRPGERPLGGDPVRSRHEHLENGQLGRRQGHVPIGQARTTGRRLQDEIAVAQHPGAVVGEAGSAQEGLDAGGELVEVEGLGQVVVGAQAQQVDPGPHRVLGGDDDDRDDREVPGPLALAQAHEQAVTGDSRQHEIEDDDIDAGVVDQVEGGSRLGGPSDVVPLGGQMSGHEPGQVGVVLDDEDARIARPSPRGVHGSPRSPSCIPLRSAPHTASSRPPAGTLADRRPGDPRPRGARPGRPRELRADMLSWGRAAWRARPPAGPPADRALARRPSRHARHSTHDVPRRTSHARHSTTVVVRSS